MLSETPTKLPQKIAEIYELKVAVAYFGSHGVTAINNVFLHT